ncbi:MAG: LysM peptidoglycan-binding domain-containing protein [bacterium]
MTTQNDGDSAYVSELKSLLKDKFFMMLLGISVAIVILSTFYSFIRPKGTESDAATTEVASNVFVTPTGSVAGAMDVVLSPTIKAQNDSEMVGLNTLLNADEATVTPVPTKVSMLDRIKSYFGSSPKATGEAEVIPVQSEETTTPVPTQPTAQPKEHMVQEGESLWSIAEKVYGSGNAYVELAKANDLVNPDLIAVGQKIMLPAMSAPSTSKGDILDSGITTVNPNSIPATYTTVEGDSLWTIAERVYKNGYEWTKIASLNNLSEPDYINPSQVLKLK